MKKLSTAYLEDVKQFLNQHSEYKIEGDLTSESIYAVLGFIFKDIQDNIMPYKNETIKYVDDVACALSKNQDNHCHDIAAKLEEIVQEQKQIHAKASDDCTNTYTAIMTKISAKDIIANAVNVPKQNSEYIEKCVSLCNEEAILNYFQAVRFFCHLEHDADFFHYIIDYINMVYTCRNAIIENDITTCQSDLIKFNEIKEASFIELVNKIVTKLNGETA